MSIDDRSCDSEKLTVTTVIKEKSRLGINIDSDYLPFLKVDSSKEIYRQKDPVCVIHGKRFLPHLNSNFNSLSNTSF